MIPGSGTSTRVPPSRRWGPPYEVREARGHGAEEQVPAPSFSPRCSSQQTRQSKKKRSALLWEKPTATFLPSHPAPICKNHQGRGQGKRPQRCDGAGGPQSLPSTETPNPGCKGFPNILESLVLVPKAARAPALLLHPLQSPAPPSTATSSPRFGGTAGSSPAKGAGCSHACSAAALIPHQHAQPQLKQPT